MAVATNKVGLVAAQRFHITMHPFVHSYKRYSCKIRSEATYVGLVIEDHSVASIMSYLGVYYIGLVSAQHSSQAWHSFVHSYNR